MTVGMLPISMSVIEATTRVNAAIPVKARVIVHEYSDASMAVFHGPRKSAEYDTDGHLIEARKEKK